MYSRKLGISESNTSNDSFNNRLREQWTQKRVAVSPYEAKKESNSDSSLENIVEKAKSGLSGLNIDIDFDTILILGLILLIIADADIPDILLLGILASLIL